ncbi:MAG: threonine--tRNA ligase [bacterium]|nr:threonine--tRNA ligase [bacterium]
MSESKISHIDEVRHSLAHLLAAAVLKKFPDAKLGIGPTIENGFYYDFLLPGTLAPEDLKEFEKTMRKFIGAKLPFTGKKVTAAQAKKVFAKQQFKLDLIKEFTTTPTLRRAIGGRGPDRSVGRNPLTIYSTGDVFMDLCRGGHVKNTSEIDADAFKLDRLAGAYWRGNEKNPQLQRVYGLAFNNKEELDKYLWQREEAKKRDHRVLGERLKLFTFAKEVGPGLPLWLPNGTIIRDEIEKYAKEVEKKWGYERVTTPHIAKEDLYRMSGHIPYYADSMYPPMKLDDGNYYLKAMNCPHTHMIYKSQPHSYKELPIRYAEYGQVYRYELSGTLAGLLRVRGFAQNDAHIYCREDQVEKEFLDVMKLHEFWYKKVFGITDFYMRLSLPAEDKTKFADMPAGWKKAVEMIRKIMEKSGLPYEEADGEAAFYGPKVDFQIKSIIGREETASTNQLDFLATARFDLTYVDADGKNKPLYVIHRAPLGSHERFIAFLIEHFAGAFPLWISPTQVEIIPVGEKFEKYGLEIKDKLLEAGIRVSMKAADETLGKRIREAEMMKIPYVLVVGEKEEKVGTVNVRHYKDGQTGEFSIAEFTQKLTKEIKDKTI